MKKILIMLAAAFALVACSMDFYRSDQMTSAMFKSDPGAAVYSTDGNYAMFKDELAFGMTDRGGFVRVYWLMTELRGDNVTLSGRTSDPLYECNTYQDTDRKEDLSYMWYICYKIIYGCNTNLEALLAAADQSAATRQLIGENYFLRAVAHFSLCNVFSTPYGNGADKPGVVIRTSTDVSQTTRATIGEVYTQIESDLKSAMEYMEGGTPRGNKGYASYDAARGLLTRLYLYMERWQDCIDLCDAMLGGNPSANLDPNIGEYFANALNSKETLWCIGRSYEDEGFVGGEKGQLSSMYYTSIPGDRGDGASGWCEMYWSEPLIDLILRNPEDKRNEYFVPYEQANDGKKFICWPEITENNFRDYFVVRDVDFNENAASNKFKFDGKEYTVKKKDGNGYPIYYIEGMYTDAQDQDGVDGGTRCWVRDNILVTGLRSGYPYPMYGMTKFCFQDGHTALSSPVYMRWAEVVLNRAEAYAHLGGKDAEAIADVNVIRKRAGIPELNGLGQYKSALELVLEERRVEFCFEGLRTMDVWRNAKYGITLDRRFGGVHPYEVLDQAKMDRDYPYCIPYTETSVSGIQGNPRQ